MTSRVLARRDGFLIDTDPAATDLDEVSGFLARRPLHGHEPPELLTAQSS